MTNCQMVVTNIFCHKPLAIRSGESNSGSSTSSNSSYDIGLAIVIMVMTNPVNDAIM